MRGSGAGMLYMVIVGNLIVQDALLDSTFRSWCYWINHMFCVAFDLSVGQKLDPDESGL